MKANLMFHDRDFKPEVCFGKDILESDLEIKHIISGMSGGDKTIAAACSDAIFNPLMSIEEIKYRQDALKDALSNPEVVRELYDIASELFTRKKESYFRLSTSQFLSNNFTNAIALLKIYLEMLTKLRAVADSRSELFKSQAFVNLMKMLRSELSDEYFKEVRAGLDELKDIDEILIGVRLGGYNQGAGYRLLQKNRKGFRRRWTFAPSYTVSKQDQEGLGDLQLRRERAINEVTNALVQAVEHIESFFTALQTELAFYVGCINLSSCLKRLGMPTCMPCLLPFEQENRSWSGLYDMSLVLTKNAPVTANDLTMENIRLCIITGANQGGKTTFLRSFGQAQLMAQCGMLVGADSFAAPVRTGIFTHFKKDEDAYMKSGKLDEELSRMSKLAGHLQRGCLVLFNESFAATNEREGSEICRNITQALIDNEVEVFSVTHLFAFADAFRDYPKVRYLRAQRLEDGERTFKIIPGEPLQTAFGEDLYKKIFA
ncbi:MAG: DNA mismatch repair protein MutS [Clostridiales bacterium]|nr:DNA mismatch repair protein MutS [Clostridiales bacterium]